MSGIKGEEDEHPASSSAVGYELVNCPSIAVGMEGCLTQQYYRNGDENHQHMVVAEERDEIVHPYLHFNHLCGLGACEHAYHDG